MKFRVKGDRNGSKFHAPVSAQSADEAIEKWLESVGETDDDWSYLEAEPWGEA